MLLNTLCNNLSKKFFEKKIFQDGVDIQNGGMVFQVAVFPLIFNRICQVHAFWKHTET
jgi:hypothetical protein